MRHLKDWLIDKVHLFLKIDKKSPFPSTIQEMEIFKFLKGNLGPLLIPPS